jgi:hypothetical protein
MNGTMICLLLAVIFFAVSGVRALVNTPLGIDWISWGLFFFALAFLIPYLTKVF